MHNSETNQEDYGKADRLSNTWCYEAKEEEGNSRNVEQWVAAIAKKECRNWEEDENRNIDIIEDKELQEWLNSRFPGKEVNKEPQLLGRRVQK